MAGTVAGSPHDSCSTVEVALCFALLACMQIGCACLITVVVGAGDNQVIKYNCNQAGTSTTVIKQAHPTCMQASKVTAVFIAQHRLLYAPAKADIDQVTLSSQAKVAHLLVLYTNYTPAVCMRA
jgi:hypothetical protein